MASPSEPFLSPEDVTALLRALADPRRHDIVRQLAASDGPVLCCALAQTALVAPPTISHHIQLLERCGLIEVSRQGRSAVLRLDRARLTTCLRQVAGDLGLDLGGGAPSAAPGRTPPPRRDP